MHYAVDYQEVGTTYVARLEGEDPPAITGRLTRWDEKLKFIDSLSPEDIVYGELGGAGDVFFLRIHRRGVPVWRITPISVKERRDAEDWNTDRDAIVIGLLAREQLDDFYPYWELEGEYGAQIANLRAAVSWRDFLQRKIRIPYELRLKSFLGKLYLIDEPTETVDVWIKAQMRDDPFFKLLKEKERQTEARIRENVINLPVYQEVFTSFMTEVPAGFVIAAIAQIQRFPKDQPAKLVAYGGWELDEDGQVPYQRKGNKILKQGMWKWVFWLNYQKPEENPWRARRDDFKRRDRECHPEVVKVEREGQKPLYLYTDQHIHDRANRKLIQKVLEDPIHKQWWALVGRSTSVA